MRKLTAFLLGLGIAIGLPVLAFTSYNYFAPGGALSCTGQCTAQSVDLTQAGFVNGPLRNGAGGTGTNSVLTGVLRGGNPFTASELSGDCTTSGSNALTCTSTAGVLFASSATTDTTNASNISSSTLPAARMPALTGDVTSAVGTVATTISANAVTNADLAQMATNTLKGNNTGGTANATDLTVTQVQTLLAIASSANPSAVVGLTTVNGSAATFLRSDAAPALSLAIAPNVANPWTASPWVWSNTEPRHMFTQSGAGADLKNWDIDVNAGVFSIRTRTDADTTGVNVVTVTRGTTTAITNISLGNATNNPSYTFLGTGTTSFGGTVSGAVYRVTGGNAAQVGTGLYLSAAGVDGFSANGTSVGTWTSGNLNITSALSAPNLAASSAAQTGTLCWTTGTGNFTVDTTTTCLLSTRRVKQDIHPLNVGLAEIMALHPVSYELRPEYDSAHLGQQVGLISEEVAVTDARLISRETDGTPLGVRYQQLTAVLVKAIQEQQHQIAHLQEQLDHDHHAHHPHR